MQSYIHKVHACLAVTCPAPALLAEMTEIFYVLLQKHEGGMDTGEIRVSTELKLTLEKKILPPLLLGLD